jgi:hypothetical protein
MTRARFRIPVAVCALAALIAACGSTNEKLVELVTDQPGARVFVDGVDTGQVTPARVGLMFGPDRNQRVFVQLMKEGYRPTFEAFYSYNVPPKKEYELKR